LMEVGGLNLPGESYGEAFNYTFAKKPKLIPINLEILEDGAESVRRK
jgi:2-oxoisovalerate ferredoxin oxidoreductase beta subunit